MTHTQGIPLSSAPQPGGSGPATQPRGAGVDCCPVCRGGEVDCDEVWHGRPLRLAECRRCSHRWTVGLTATPEAQTGSELPRYGQRGSWRRSGAKSPRVAA